MARDTCDFYFSLWAIFRFFTPNSPKNQNFKKMKKKDKTPGDLIILHMSTKTIIR